jgi:hypothetical protein
MSRSKGYGHLIVLGIVIIALAALEMGWERRAEYWRKQYDTEKSVCVGVDGPRTLIAREDIRDIVAACKANPHHTEMVSADASWDIPIDCRRMLKQYGKENGYARK